MTDTRVQWARNDFDTVDAPVVSVTFTVRVGAGYEVLEER
jgi:hypothetical protein